MTRCDSRPFASTAQTRISYSPAGSLPRSNSASPLARSSSVSVFDAPPFGRYSRNAVKRCESSRKRIFEESKSVTKKPTFTASPVVTVGFT